MDVQLVQTIVTILGALGVSEIVRGIVAWVRGRPQREQQRVQDERERAVAEQQRADDALALVDQIRAERDELHEKHRIEMDKETFKRRRIAEHASKLRRMLTDANVSDIPDWPIDADQI